MRTVADTASLRTAIEAAAHPRVRVTFPFEIPRLVSPELPGWASTTVSYTSDLPLLSGWGEGYQLGPGSILVAHTAEERIRKRDLLDGVEQYVKLAGELLRGRRRWARVVERTEGTGGAAEPRACHDWW